MTGETKASFESLPNEIITHIVLSCDLSQEVAGVALTSRRFHSIANPLLYHREISNDDYYVAFWAARENRTGTLQHVLEALRPGDHGFNVWAYWKGKRRYHSGPLSTQDRRRVSSYVTPIHEAADAGALDAVKFLLGHGADIDAPSLCFSYEVYHPNEYAWYLDFKDRANFDTHGLVEFSPLIISIIFQKPEISDLLLRSGASTQINLIRTGQPCGTTALHIAAAVGAAPIVRQLLEGGYCKPDELDGVGYPPLLWAAINDQGYPALQALIDYGADVNYVIPSGLGPEARHSMVYTLTKRGHPKAAKKLVEFGAFPALSGGEGMGLS